VPNLDMTDRSKRYCARGDQCSQYTRLGMPQPLRSTSKNPLREPCQREYARRALEEVSRATPSPAPRTQEAVNKESPSEESAVLKSDAASKLRRLKGELVLQLFTRKGEFWNAVEETRTIWRIRPVTQLPQFADEDELFIKGDLARTQRIFELRKNLVPERYCYLGECHWDRFISACVQYDPPENDLLEFAAFSDPEPFPVLPERPLSDTEATNLPLMVTPPIKMLPPDPIESEKIEETYWLLVIHELWRRHLKPAGMSKIHLHAEINDINQSLSGNPSPYIEGAKERNKPRPFIEVDEFTTEDDVVNAWRLIAATQEGRSKGGAPSRDRLLAVQCAVIKDNHNWTFKQIGQRYDRLRSRDAVRDHINLGREILKES
jgi:hypothetical protein